MRYLEIWVNDHSRSFEMAPTDRSYTTSIVSTAQSCTIFEIFYVEEYSDVEI